MWKKQVSPIQTYAALLVVFLIIAGILEYRLNRRGHMDNPATETHLLAGLVLGGFFMNVHTDAAGSSSAEYDASGVRLKLAARRPREAYLPFGGADTAAIARDLMAKMRGGGIVFSRRLQNGVPVTQESSTASGDLDRFYLSSTRPVHWPVRSEGLDTDETKSPADRRAEIGDANLSLDVTTSPIPGARIAVDIRVTLLRRIAIDAALDPGKTFYTPILDYQQRLTVPREAAGRAVRARLDQTVAGIVTRYRRDNALPLPPPGSFPRTTLPFE